VVLDCVGASMWASNVAMLNVGGRLAVYGSLGGVKVREVHLGKLFAKRISVGFTTLRGQSTESKARIVEGVRGEMFEEGMEMPPVDCVVEMERVEEAHRRVLGNRNFGKVILLWGGFEIPYDLML